MDNKLEVLKRTFGYSSFREGQEEIIDAVLAGQDTLGIMPTGAGKSLCFQIPALLLEGITLVISPLISLMKDQVYSLNQNGVRAAYLNSSLRPRQYHMAIQKAAQGEYKIIYVAPERLLTEEFLAFVSSVPIAMVAVDEAHCVSQWGQDFRPSYLSIPRFMEFPPARPRLCAFTATATPKVREDIVRILKLEQPFVQLTSFDRPNLYYEVQRPKNKDEALIDLLQRMEGQNGIVYCSTRKHVEEVCAALCGRGYPATRYHAGLDDLERRANQEDFLFDRKSVMVATNAFGMGIDKSNVSFVIHYDMPKDLESYYQEAGRAGRDGEPASCVLLYNGRDVVTNQFLLDHSEENELLDEETRAQVQQAGRERLRQMTFYSTTSGCLREFILNYFGEKAPNYCGNCFNCNHLFEELDVTVPAQMILSCVKRTGERYGVRLIIDVLRGTASEKVSRLGLDQQSTFGLLESTKESRIREMIQFLIRESCLVLSEGQYPVLSLGPEAWEVLHKKKDLTMRLVKESEVRQKAPRRKQGKKQPVLEGEADQELLQRLRELRGRLAAEQNMPSYIIFSNAVLHEMAVRIPKTAQELLMVSGVGRKKMELYGEAFLNVIREYCKGI